MLLSLTYCGKSHENEGEEEHLLPPVSVRNGSEVRREKERQHVLGEVARRGHRLRPL